MSVRPKSILRQGTKRFHADMDIQKFGDGRMGTKVRVKASPEDFHMIFSDSFGKRVDQFFDTNPFD